MLYQHLFKTSVCKNKMKPCKLQNFRMKGGDAPVGGIRIFYNILKVSEIPNKIILQFATGCCSSKICFYRMLQFQNMILQDASVPKYVFTGCYSSKICFYRMLQFQNMFLQDATVPKYVFTGCFSSKICFNRMLQFQNMF